MELIFVTIAKWYGYYTIGSLLKANFGLIILISAFIVVCLLLYQLLDRQFPRPGRDDFKRWVFKIIILFSISAFIFIAAFTVFYEVRKSEKHSYIQSAYRQSSVV